MHDSPLLLLQSETINYEGRQAQPGSNPWVKLIFVPQNGGRLKGIDLSKGQRRKRYSLPTGRPESSATIGLQGEPETS